MYECVYFSAYFYLSYVRSNTDALVPTVIASPSILQFLVYCAYNLQLATFIIISYIHNYVLA